MIGKGNQELQKGFLDILRIKEKQSVHWIFNGDSKMLKNNKKSVYSTLILAKSFLIRRNVNHRQL